MGKRSFSSSQATHFRAVSGSKVHKYTSVCSKPLYYSDRLGLCYPNEGVPVGHAYIKVLALVSDSIRGISFSTFCSSVFSSENLLIFQHVKEDIIRTSTYFR